MTPADPRRSSDPPPEGARPPVAEPRLALASKIFAANLLVVGVSIVFLLVFREPDDTWQSLFGVLLVVAGGAWLIARRLTRDLEALSRATRTVGAGDLANAAPPRPATLLPDEVDVLAGALGSMVADLRRLVSHLTRAAASVTGASGDVVEHTRAVREEAAAMAGRSADVARRSGEQSDRARRQGETVGRVAESLRRAADIADQTARATRETAVSATRGTEASRNALGRVRSAFEQVGAAEEAVLRFSENTAEIHAVVEVISHIAEQTHLLSVNASIEAARAGEAGRGFAVVAEEIRRLADGAARSAERIQALVRGLDAHTRAVVDTMQSSNRELSAGRSEIDGIARTLDRIASAAEREVQSAEAFSELSRQQLGLIDEVVGEVDTVRQGADHIAEAAREMETASAGQRDRSRALDDSARALAEVAADLDAAASRFRL